MTVIILFFFFLRLIDWLIDWLLCWVFVSVLGLSLVAASGGHSSLWCAGLSLSWPLLLRRTGSRRTGSVVVAHGPSCSGHVGSSQTRARARVPCISRQILNHCATREALSSFFSDSFSVNFFVGWNSSFFEKSFWENVALNFLHIQTCLYCCYTWYWNGILICRFSSPLFSLRIW